VPQSANCALRCLCSLSFMPRKNDLANVVSHSQTLSLHGAYRLAPALKGSGDSTIEKSCSRFTSGMVGVNWRWAKSEDVLIWKVCCHQLKLRFGERFNSLPESCLTQSCEG